MLTVSANLPKAGQGCILLDLEMPGLSGPDLQSRLSQDAPLLPIIYLTGRGDIKGSVRAIKDGAEDFIEKPASGKAIGEAIERALLQYDKRYLQHQRLQCLQTLVASLTPREYQVFNLMIRGKRNKQIAYDIRTSERTVKAHRHCVMEKLSAHSLAEAVSIAERMGLLDSSTNQTRPQ